LKNIFLPHLSTEIGMFVRSVALSLFCMTTTAFGAAVQVAERVTEIGNGYRQQAGDLVTVATKQLSTVAGVKEVTYYASVHNGKGWRPLRAPRDVYNSLESQFRDQQKEQEKSK
jgi:hypothetical protein